MEMSLCSQSLHQNNNNLCCLFYLWMYLRCNIVILLTHANWNTVYLKLKSMQTKRRRIADSDEPAIITFIDLPKDLTSQDIEYFIQKDYNIESRFFQPNFLELCMYSKNLCISCNMFMSHLMMESVVY